MYSFVICVIKVNVFSNKINAINQFDETYCRSPAKTQYKQTHKRTHTSTHKISKKKKETKLLLSYIFHKMLFQTNKP